MRLLSLQLALGPADGDPDVAPVAWGGVLHGFVERAVMNHAPALLPLLRPAGRQALASFTIVPPPWRDAAPPVATGPDDDGRLTFGLVLFGALAQRSDALTEALAAQCARRLHGRPARLIAAETHDAPLHPPASPVDPPGAIRLHRLVLRSPLLLASGGATHDGLRRHGHLPWPPLGSVLESVAARMRTLAPARADDLGLTPAPGRWRATPAQWATEPLTPAADPAREVVAPYATRDHRFTAPGLIGTLVYPSHAPALEAALLYWGQWLGVGQKTTMGFGSYVWQPIE